MDHLMPARPVEHLADPWLIAPLARSSEAFRSRRRVPPRQVDTEVVTTVNTMVDRALQVPLQDRVQSFHTLRSPQSLAAQGMQRCRQSPTSSYLALRKRKDPHLPSCFPCSTQTVISSCMPALPSPVVSSCLCTPPGSAASQPPVLLQLLVHLRTLASFSSDHLCTRTCPHAETPPNASWKLSPTQAFRWTLRASVECTQGSSAGVRREPLSVDLGSARGAPVHDKARAQGRIFSS